MTAFKSQCTAFSRPIDAGQLLRQGAAGRSDQAMDSAWLVSLRVPQAPRSNTDPHVVAECPQPLARLHVPWRKLVWARPDDDFPEAAQANVRNCPVVAADRVPESGQHTFPTPPPKAMAHQADFPCALSAVPTANLSRLRSFRSVLNPVPPSQTSPWATASMPTSTTNGFGCLPRKPRLSSQRSSRCLLKCSAWVRILKRAAAIMSLIQSARNNGHDPYAYLKDVLTRLPSL